MRIISGKYKGRRISAPKKLPIRPTTDMAKESLFNILNNLYYFDEISVLDLFAGSGSISYEFYSRGTEQITAVDSNFDCVKFIHSTSEQLAMPIRTIKTDVYAFLKTNKSQFTVIFADPPYGFEHEKFESIANLVFKHKALEEQGVLVIEHSKHTDLSEVKNFSYSKNYGGSVFSFFEMPKE